jgi:hypothetical protein
VRVGDPKPIAFEPPGYRAAPDRLEARNASDHGDTTGHKPRNDVTNHGSYMHNPS